MRRPERIDIVLEKMDWKRWVEYFCDEEDQGWVLTQIMNNLPKIKKLWKESYDQRLGQLLINNALFPDNSAWYHEETDWLVEQKICLPEEVYFWGRNFNVNNEKLPETEWILWKDLDLDHIKAIINWFDGRAAKLNEQMRLYFNKRLNGSKDSKDS